MNNYIYVSLTGFVFKPIIQIRKGDNVTEYQCSMKNLPDTILGLCQKEDIKEVKIKGSKTFAGKYKLDILNSAKEQYNNSSINIEII